ncbi:MAG: flagellar basal body L-ring protein FlgH [Candidatus Latescibacteria bacterium]|nr:flagellar basal body L-ring protein FlgH [Candidatus Latescibacterota bacterium]
MRLFYNILFIIVFSACFAISVFAQSPSGSASVPGWSSSLYSDVKAYKIGDVLSVIIAESNSASKNSQTSTKKQNKTAADGSATTGALSGLFPGMSGSIDASNQFNGQGSTVRNGKLDSRITVKVIDVLANNNLLIEGSKTLELNEDTEVVTISGVVQPEYISSDNSVYSYQIANAKIVYKGKGSVSQGHRPGFLTRIINWIL